MTHSVPILGLTIALAACSGSPNEPSGSAAVEGRELTSSDRSASNPNTAVLDLSGFGTMTPGEDEVPITPTTDAAEPVGLVDAAETTTTRPAESPVRAIERIRTELEAGIGSASDGDVLDALAPLDDAPSPSDAIGIRDGVSINEAGEANRLDQAAALACSDVEVAMTALDEGRGPDVIARLRSAADHAARSTAAGVASWSPVLLEQANAPEDKGGVDPALLPAFLSTCTDGGYEL